MATKKAGKKTAKTTKGVKKAGKKTSRDGTKSSSKKK